MSCIHLHAHAHAHIPAILSFLSLSLLFLVLLLRLRLPGPNGRGWCVCKKGDRTLLASRHPAPVHTPKKTHKTHRLWSHTLLQLHATRLDTAYLSPYIVLTCLSSPESNWGLHSNLPALLTLFCYPTYYCLTFI
ncbi:hypothetical protein GGS23DRAFT_569862 [Durotheca rogersii]|uniref:uncharacterized protein n=1 Tax=Durotheca rogersii TaxID=419775 RepID=UPI00222036DB|nr:uncharacterized protein GGS23DRAFT_569862 [Durotheca rogersii]KAI5862871.1 hypothetical protein GGS23DRAFT_569862 [Durotheca rogersii]